MSVFKERLELEEKESLTLLKSRSLPQKDHQSLSVGEGEKKSTPKIKTEDSKDS